MRRWLIVVAVLLVAAGGIYWFGWRKRLPYQAEHALERDTNMVLYSLYPDRRIFSEDGTVAELPQDAPKFHGYMILGQTAITTAEARQVVAKSIRNAVADSDGTMFNCFEPRHGVRVEGASGTYEFLICFDCGRMMVYPPNSAGQEVPVHGSSKPMNEILTAAQVPLPKR